MGIFGNLNKKTIIHVLSSGCEYLIGSLEDGTIEETDYKNYYDLKDVLYHEGQTLLSITNKVKYERKLNSIKNKLDKKFNENNNAVKVEGVGKMKTYYNIIYAWSSKSWFLEAFKDKTLDQIKEFLNKHFPNDFEREDFNELAEEIKEFMDEK